MMKNLLLSTVLSFAFAGGAMVSDTVTITAPGGGTQAVSTTVVAAAITEATNGQVSVGSITQTTPGGDFTVVVSGTAYVVSSGFIAMLLAYYS